MEQRIIQYCREAQLLSPGMGVVAGVSGGADSVCLLRILVGMRSEWKLRIVAVHVHHGIRGSEADADLAFVKKICGEWDVPLVVEMADVPEIARKEHLSLEEAGRNVRYEIFRRVLKERDCQRIAVAHHLDDQAETVLMNLLRGSGIHGLSGIWGRRGEIVRPLLCVRRCEIEEWLVSQRIDWRTDRTNLEEDFLRNRVRNCLIPALTADFNPRVVEHIAQTAADLREADMFLQQEAARRLVDWERKQDADFGRSTDFVEDRELRRPAKERIYAALTGRQAVIPLALLENESSLMCYYLVRQGLLQLEAGLKDISRVHIGQVLALRKGQGRRSVDLPGGVRACVEYDRIVLEDTRSVVEDTEFEVSLSVFFLRKQKNFPQNCCVNWFDYDKIKDVVCLRRRRQGDRICVAAGGKCKRLKDYLIDAKMPAGVRDRWPLLAMGDRILWVPGYRMDEDCKIGPQTTRVLQVTLNKKGVIEGI